MQITQKWPAKCGNIIPKTWFAKESNPPYLHVWVQNVHVRCCFTIHDTNWPSAENWIPMVNSLKKKNVIWVRISFPTPSSMFKKTDAKNTFPFVVSHHRMSNMLNITQENQPTPPLIFVSLCFCGRSPSTFFGSQNSSKRPSALAHSAAHEWPKHPSSVPLKVRPANRQSRCFFDFPLSSPILRELH